MCELDHLSGLLHLGTFATALAIAFLGLDQLDPNLRKDKIDTDLRASCVKAFEKASEKTFGQGEANLKSKGYITKDNDLFLPDHIERKCAGRLLRFLRAKLLNRGAGIRHHERWLCKAWGKFTVHCLLWRWIAFSKRTGLSTGVTLGLGALSLLTFLALVACDLWAGNSVSITSVAFCNVSHVIDLRLWLYTLYVLTICAVILTVAIESTLPDWLEKKCTKWFDKVRAALAKDENFAVQRIENQVPVQPPGGATNLSTVLRP